MIYIRKLLAVCLLTLVLAACAVPGAEPLDETAAALQAMQEELQALREENEQLAQNIEDIQQAEQNEQNEQNETPEPEVITDVQIVYVEPSPVPTPETGNTNETTQNGPIQVEVTVVEPPEPSPAPSPAPASLPGRWTTIGLAYGSEVVSVPAEESFELELFSGGTGLMRVQGIGSPFNFSGGDTGYQGRLELNFTEGFGHANISTAVMTYRITGTQMNLTHTLFGETQTTVLLKAQ